MRPISSSNKESWKRDTISSSHPSVKLAPVRIFSCKHPLICESSALLPRSYQATLKAAFSSFRSSDVFEEKNN